MLQAVDSVPAELRLDFVFPVYEGEILLTDMKPLTENSDITLKLLRHREQTELHHVVQRQRASVPPLLSWLT